MAIAQQLNVNTEASAMEMAETIFGSGITIVDAAFHGDAVQSATYSGALSTLDGISPSDAGVILSTGRVADFAPYSDGGDDTNRSAGLSTDVEGGIDGDDDLDALAGSETYDGAILTATFIPDGNWITMQFVFSSEEYLEYINQGYNDVFGVWVNGVFAPVSVLEGGVASIDTVNNTVNSNLYLDNPAGTDPYNTEMDGLTRVLTVKAPVNPGVPNTIKLAIADHGDSVYDSNVLIMANSIQSTTIAFEDELSMEPDTIRILDVLNNDRSVDGEQLVITHVNGQAISQGQTVVLPSGESVTLNTDWTLTIANDGDLGTSLFTYTVQNAQGITDIGIVSLHTTTVLSPDGIVQGTGGGEVIDLDYLGDPDGDRIDADDALGVGGTTGDGDYVLALGGDDTVLAGAGNDIVYGGSGDDWLFGGAGDDFLSGDAGNDLLFGGTGNDTLAGGADADRFMLDADFGQATILGGESVTTGVDHDVIDAVMIKDDVAVTFTGNEAGVLTSGSSTAQFFEIEAIVLGAGHDTVDASLTSTGVEVDGGTGDDLLIGGSGNDTLWGGEGADTLAGGRGDDLLMLGDADGRQDIVVLADDGGHDTVIAFEAPVDNGDGSFTVGDLLDVSGLFDGGGEPVNVLDVVVTPSGPDTMLTFPDGTSVTLRDIVAPDENQLVWLEALGIPAAPVVIPPGPVDGTAGDDLIIAGYVDGDGDQIDGSDGLDDTVYGNAGDDLIQAGAGNDLVYGGSGNDSIEATEGENTLHGDAGHDVIFGGSGDDLIYGGTGNDTLAGGAGNDLLDGGDDADLFLITENAGADTIVGGEGGVDFDTLDLSASDAAVSVVFTGDEAGSANLPGTIVSFTEIEAVALGGGDDLVNATASGAAVHVSAGAGDDTLLGGGGNDTLIGGEGQDLLDGGPGGDDLLYGGGGDDQFAFRNGFGNDTAIGGETGEIFGDRIDAIGVTGNVTLTMTGNESGTLTDGSSTLTFAEIERFDLGAGDDYVDARVTSLGSGYHAGEGNDTLLGGSGHDRLFGGAGSDVIAGGAGNDHIDLGGTEPFGDGDADTVILVNGDGHDRIVNFDRPLDNGDGTWTGIDRFDVSGMLDLAGNPVNVDDVTVTDTNGDGTGDAILTFPDGTSVWLQDVPVAAVASPAQLVAIGIPAAPTGPAPNYIVTGSSGADLIDSAYLDDPEGDRIDAGDALDGSNDDLVFALGGDDTVMAGLGNDTVYGGTGNDLVYGGAGNDHLHGDAGQDTLIGGAGDDMLYGGDGSDTFVLQDDGGFDQIAGGEDDLGDDLDLLDASGLSQSLLVDFTDGEAGTATHADNVVTFSEIERYVLGAGDDTVNAFGDRGAISIDGHGGEDVLNISAADLRAADVDLDDGMSGIFTPAHGGAEIAFGPGHPLRLSDVLERNGAIQLFPGSVVSGRVGDISFANFETVNFNVVCFVRGTRIKTDRGEIEIETLQAGDRVLTLDNGFQEIRWVGSSRRPAQGKLAPIRFRAGALGNDRDLLVSPQHRMLLRGWQANLMFGSSEVLVCAKSLVNDVTVLREEGGEVEYFHLLFDRHEIIFAEGAASESFHPGQEGWKALDAGTRDEILELFPELQVQGLTAYGEAARPTLRDYEGRVLAEAILTAA